MLLGGPDTCLVDACKLLHRTEITSSTVSGDMSSTASGGASQSAITGDVVAFTMSFFYASIHLPADLLRLLYFMCALSFCFVWGTLHEIDNTNLSLNISVFRPTANRWTAVDINLLLVHKLFMLWLAVDVFVTAVALTDFWILTTRIRRAIKKVNPTLQSNKFRIARFII